MSGDQATTVRSPIFGSSIAAPTQMPETDAELLERFGAGEGSAFDEIVRRYHERIFQFVYRVLQDFDEAADIAQETFIRAYDKLERFHGRSSLYTWLYRIALNLSINSLRKRKLRHSVGLNEVPGGELRSGEADPAALLDDSETRRRIELAIAELPTRQRSIFVLRQYEGLTHAEVASVVGSSEGAVRAGYFHAVRKLRLALEDLVVEDLPEEGDERSERSQRAGGG